MKIGAGIYKNRTVKVLGDISRPTTVRSRTVIFDILRNLIEPGYRFLDSYAGSGIMGMEALSRGAGQSIFFEVNKKCIKLIEENLKSMDKLVGTYVVHKCNALVPPKGSPVDVIFMDPPYDKPFLINDTIKKLLKYNWIDKNTIIITEMSIYTKWEPRDVWNVELLKEKSISKSLIRFFTINAEENDE